MEETNANSAGIPSADEMAKLKAEQEARAQEIADAREKLAKMLEEPIEEMDARKADAELAIQRGQLLAYVASLKTQIAQAEERLAAIDCEQAVLRRRLLNGAPGQDAK